MNDEPRIRVLRAREGGAVKRCHTMPWIGHYDVAQHTFNMLTLLDILFWQPASRSLAGVSVEDRIRYLTMIRSILWHDAHERWTGDVPYGLRHFDPEVRKNFLKAAASINNKLDLPDPALYADESRWVRSLDQLEFFLSCHDQLNLGNESARCYTQDSKKWLLSEAVEPVREFVEKFVWQRTPQSVEDED